MNEQDKQLLERYLKDERKKKIIYCIFAIVFIGIFLFYGYYAKVKKSSSEIDTNIQEETSSNIINENTTNEITDSKIENTQKQNQVDETTKDDSNKENKQDASNQETKENPKETTQTAITSKESKEKSTNEKPANKDFLFTDGYTMDNVTQAAQDYLKSYDFSGECVPIKDNEGIYLGMRVIFY